ncbi:MAG: TetR/AcrR family transcriptional regulator [Chloroflexi bacterium]|nr:MAG: TetR/AcrR family transcriptional regulator [Chloroflexota bacterium]RLT34254.1 MAG: TetR/AcrR family transcriptional regulator [Chloroflexota bacterium]
MVRGGQQTAEKILETAHHLFMARGYVGVSINEVVQTVGITKPSLYYHYADKESLYAAVAERALDTMGTELRAAISDADMPFAHQLRAVILAIQAHNGEDFRMMRHEMRVHLDATHQHRIGMRFYASMMAPIETLMERGISLGELVGRSASELAMLFLCLIEAYTGPEAMAVHLRLTADHISEMFLYGVAAPRVTRVEQIHAEE